MPIFAPGFMLYELTNFLKMFSLERSGTLSYSLIVSVLDVR